MAEVKQVSTGSKLESIGTVKTVVGEVKAVDAAGNERILQAGDKVFANETIVTAAGGLVMIEFADGTHLDLPSAAQIVLDTDVFNPANAAASEGKELTAEQIQEMIARGEDPTAVTEATAAGIGSGDEGGSSFIVVDFNNAQGGVTSGFNTLGIPGPESTTFTELPPVEDEAVPASVPVVSVAVEVEVEVDGEDGTPPPEEVLATTPGVVVDGVSIVEGTEDQGRVVNFVIKLDQAYTQDVTVSYQINNGVAEAGSDFTGVLVGTVTIPAGQTSFIVPVTIVQDSDIESNENFSIVLTGATNATINPAASSATVTIIDDDVNADNDTDSVSESQLESSGGVFHGSIQGEGQDTANVLDNDDLSNAFAADGTTPLFGPLQVAAAIVPVSVFIGETNTVIGDVTFAANGTYTLTLNPAGKGLVSSLAEGQTLQVTADYLMFNTVGSSDTATLTITINGSNDTPTITTDSGNPQGANDVVYEAGLANGSDAAANSEFATGTFTLSDPDGLDDIQSVSINGGAPILLANLVGTSVNSANGTLTVTAYNVATGVATYTFQLTSPTTDGVGAETNVFTLTTSDGTDSSAPATITIEIADDVPNAVNDTNSISEDAVAAITGNVLTNDLHANNQPGADTPASFVSWASTAASYGTFTDTGNGTYSYTLNNGLSAVQNLDSDQTLTETFSYTMKDADGDTKTATLTITINGSNDTPTITTDSGNPQGANDVVYEAGLANGSDAAANSEFATGTFTLSDPDGLDDIQSVSINGGAPILLANLVGTSVNSANGTLTVTAYNVATGVATYTFQLTSPTTDGVGAETNVFTLTTSDGTDSSAPATITIEIADDVPNAVNDTNSISEDAVAAITGNVLTNDLHANNQPGADTPASFVSWASTAASYGTFTDTGNGTYSYTLNNGLSAVQNLDSDQTLTETFSYTMKDADGDTKTATLTITINGSNDTPTITTDSGNPQGANDVVYEAGLANGSDAAANSEFATGTFTLSDPDGLDDIQSVSINGGAPILLANLVGTSVNSANGTLTVTAYNVATGVATYTFQLTSPTTDGVGAETNVFTLTTSDGTDSSAPATITIEIVDDLPVVAADSGAVTEGATLSKDAANGVLSNDVSGADGWNGTGAVVGVVAGNAVVGTVNANVGVQITGAYGNLTLNADGSYTYVSTANAVTSNAQDVFVYTVKDGDGDLKSTTLTINVADVTGTPTTTTGTVSEAGIDASAGQAPGTAAAGNTEKVIDGSLNLQSGWTAVAGSGSTAYATWSVGADGKFNYTLTKSTTDAAGAETDSFTYTAKDANGNTVTNTVTITITDDVPVVAADSGNVGEGATLTVNAAAGVLNNDVSGADGWNGSGAVVGVVAGSTVADTVNANVGVQITGAYGNLTLNADGSYTYVSTANAVTANAQDVFVYTVKDGDGDLKSTTLTINVADVTGVPQNTTTTVYEAAMDTTKTGSDLVASSVTGTNPSSSTETATGSLLLASGWTAVAKTGTTPYGSYEIKADGTYTYTLVNAPHVSGTSTTETINYTSVDALGNTVTNTVTVTIFDDVPTFTYINNGIIANQVGTLTGTHDLTFGADGESSINLSALTSLSGVNYSSAVHNLDGSTTITAGTNTSTTNFFSLTVYANGTYSFNLLDPRPDVVKVADFGSVQGGQAVTSLTLGTGANAITFTGLGGDQIKPTSAGFGVNDGNLNAGDDFSVTFGGNKVDNVTFSIKQQSSTAFGMTWTTDTGETGTVSFSADGNLVINPLSDFSTITFNTTSGSAKVDSFSYSQNLLPDNQVLQFSVSGTDGDGDISASQTLSLQLLGGVIGAPINGTAGSESILGTSSGETIDGKAGNDIISGGLGDDILIGGTGSDTFVWKSGESGADKVTDFTKGVGGDVLNLADILQGEHSTAASLGSYLSFSYNAGTNITTITIDSNGVTAGGTGQSIQVNGDLTYGSSDPTVIINKLLADGNLKTDA